MLRFKKSYSMRLEQPDLVCPFKEKSQVHSFTETHPGFITSTSTSTLFNKNTK